MDASTPTLTMEGVNYLAVLVGVLATFVLGFVWYSKFLFMDRWMKGAKLKAKDAKDANMIQVMGGTFLVTLLGGVTLAALMQALGFDTFAQGASFGLLIGGGFLATSRVMHSLYEQKPLDYTLINLGYDVLVYAVIGGVVGLMA